MMVFNCTSTQSQHCLLSLLFANYLKLCLKLTDGAVSILAERKTESRVASCFSPHLHTGVYIPAA